MCNPVEARVRTALNHARNPMAERYLRALLADLQAPTDATLTDLVQCPVCERVGLPQRIVDTECPHA